MAAINFIDESDDFRIEVIGNFAGACVRETEIRWEKILAQGAGRRITMDITRCTGYDLTGRRILRRMHQHGVVFAAGTPDSLHHLADITAAPRRGPLPAVVPQPASNRPRSAAAEKPRSAAAGTR